MEASVANDLGGSCNVERRKGPNPKLLSYSKLTGINSSSAISLLMRFTPLVQHECEKK